MLLGNGFSFFRQGNRLNKRFPRATCSTATFGTCSADPQSPTSCREWQMYATNPCGWKLRHHVRICPEKESHLCPGAPASTKDRASFIAASDRLPPGTNISLVNNASSRHFMAHYVEDRGLRTTHAGTCTAGQQENKHSWTDGRSLFQTLRCKFCNLPLAIGARTCDGLRAGSQ